MNFPPIIFNNEKFPAIINQNHSQTSSLVISFQNLCKKLLKYENKESNFEQNIISWIKSLTIAQLFKYFSFKNSWLVDILHEMILISNSKPYMKFKFIPSFTSQEPQDTKSSLDYFNLFFLSKESPKFSDYFNIINENIVLLSRGRSEGEQRRQELIDNIRYITLNSGIKNYKEEDNNYQHEYNNVVTLSYEYLNNIDKLITTFQLISNKQCFKYPIEIETVSYYTNDNNNSNNNNSTKKNYYNFRMPKWLKEEFTFAELFCAYLEQSIIINYMYYKMYKSEISILYYDKFDELIDNSKKLVEFIKNSGDKKFEIIRNLRPEEIKKTLSENSHMKKLICKRSDKDNDIISSYIGTYSYSKKHTMKTIINSCIISIEKVFIRGELDFVLFLNFFKDNIIFLTDDFAIKIIADIVYNYWKSKAAEDLLQDKDNNNKGKNNEGNNKKKKKKKKKKKDKNEEEINTHNDIENDNIDNNKNLDIKENININNEDIKIENDGKDNNVNLEEENNKNKNSNENVIKEDNNINNETELNNKKEIKEEIISENIINENNKLISENNINNKEDEEKDNNIKSNNSEINGIKENNNSEDINDKNNKTENEIIHKKKKEKDFFLYPTVKESNKKKKNKQKEKKNIIQNNEINDNNINNNQNENIIITNIDDDKTDISTDKATSSNTKEEEDKINQNEIIIENIENIKEKNKYKKEKSEFEYTSSKQKNKFNMGKRLKQSMEDNNNLIIPKNHYHRDSNYRYQKHESFQFQKDEIYNNNEMNLNSEESNYLKGSNLPQYTSFNFKSRKNKNYRSRYVNNNMNNSFNNSLPKNIIEFSKEIINNTMKVNNNKKILQQLREKYIKIIYENINIILRNSKVEFQCSFYGSSVSGLSIENSDIDIMVKLRKKSEDKEYVINIMNIIVDNLKKIKLNYLKKIIPISSASVPVIKINCDLSYDLSFLSEINSLSLNNNIYYNDLTKLFFDITFFETENELEKIPSELMLDYIKKCTMIYPQIFDIVYIMKRYLYNRKLNKSYQGGLSSYSLFLLTLAFIKSYKNKYEIAIGSLFIEYLYFYSNFNFYNTVIQPNKDDNIFENIEENNLQKFNLNIIDPITGLNVAKSTFKIDQIQIAFKNGYENIVYNLVDLNYNNLGTVNNNNNNQEPKKILENFFLLKIND